MKQLFILILLAWYIILPGQYATYYGDDMSPRDTIHVLNIFINIVYDLCDTCDPLGGTVCQNWLPGKPDTINTSPPVYLAEFMDREYTPGNVHGITKFWADASFNNFIVLGDFVSVDIAQSKITPGCSTCRITERKLLDSTIALINQLGGLQTIYNHNTLDYYDGYLNFGNTAQRFLPKDNTPADGDIDYVQFFLRNSTDYFGGHTGGGRGFAYVYNDLIVNGDTCFYNRTTIQGAIKDSDLSHPLGMSSMIEVHEMAHHLIEMSNRGHMGGGIPLTTGDLITLSSNSGWSIIGSAPSCLVSCNAFERWRLNWLGPDNDAYPIAASNIDSDIEKSDGNKVFTLRDFVTYGDAIRIKLPYKDEGALDQYIWLEYHRIHQNGKIDYPTYYDAGCKDDGIPGIFAYYQVGKDLLFSNVLDSIIRDTSDLLNITDHLIPICADGRWDIRKLTETADPCMYEEGMLVNIQEYYQENPFCGYNDLSCYHYFNDVPENELNWKTSGIQAIVKKQDGIVTNRLHSLGDNGDPFVNRSMSISSNPAPVNVITYHHRRGAGGAITKSSRIDNRKIHLSGLYIHTLDNGDGTTSVLIDWNMNYVNNNIRWVGDIVLHERVDLATGKKITFDQNQTPDKHIRDSRTGLFTGPTYFTCLGSSEFKMYHDSEVELKSLSSFLTNDSSNLRIDDNSEFIVKQGTTLVIEDGSNLVISGGGKLEVETGGCLCIENGAYITLQDASSRIHLQQDVNKGVNTTVLPGSYDCRYNIVSTPFSGSGSIIEDVNSQDRHIQNETINNTRAYVGRNIYFGEKVTSTKPFGQVTLGSGANVTAVAFNSILIDNGFEAQAGAGFEIRVEP